VWPRSLAVLLLHERSPLLAESDLSRVMGHPRTWARWALRSARARIETDKAAAADYAAVKARL
jgi:hypothetical protein